MRSRRVHRSFSLPFIEKREYIRISMEIEKQIKRDRKRSLKEMKILVLGAAESGKSTFIKQMKIIEGKGFDTFEREEAKYTIWSNLLTSTCIILKCYMNDIKKPDKDTFEHRITDQKKHFSLKQVISWQSADMFSFWKEKSFPTENDLFEHGEELLRYITLEEASHINYYLKQVLNEETVYIEGQYEVDKERRMELLKCIFDDYKFTELLLSWNMFKLPDSAFHFLANADRILEEKYVPSNQDILRMRKPTIGIAETMVNFGDVIFRFVDVGGQRPERKKWIYLAHWVLYLSLIHI